MKVQAPILVDERFIVDASYERAKQKSEAQNMQKKKAGSCQKMDSFAQPSEIALIRTGLNRLYFRWSCFFLSLFRRHVTPYGSQSNFS